MAKNSFVAEVTFNVVNKINSKLKFLSRKNSFLTLALRHLLCNACINTAPFWLCMFCLVSKSNKEIKTIQTTQNRCMRFCLQLDKLKHISYEEFEHLNWLPVTYRFKQCVNAIVFKYFHEQCSNYLNEVFDVAT